MPRSIREGDRHQNQLLRASVATLTVMLAAVACISMLRGHTQVDSLLSKSSSADQVALQAISLAESAIRKEGSHPRASRNIAIQALKLAQEEIAKRSASPSPRKIVKRFRQQLDQVPATDAATAAPAGAAAAPAEAAVAPAPAEDEAQTEYIYSPDPLNFMSRKTLDPVLNKKITMNYKLPCEDRGNCVTADDAKYLAWRSLKQKPLGSSADEQMATEFDQMQKKLDANSAMCADSFGDDKESADACTAKETREICYRYEALAQICTQSTVSRNNDFDGTKYFAQAFLLKSCDEGSRKKIEDACKTHEKLPGVNVWHWPWMGHTWTNDEQRTTPVMG